MGLFAFNEMRRKATAEKTAETAAISNEKPATMKTADEAETATAAVKNKTRKKAATVEKKEE